MLKKGILSCLITCFLFTAAMAQEIEAFEQIQTDSTAPEPSLLSPKDKDEYTNLLFLKVKKGKGYRDQGFEMKGRYALLEPGVSYLSFNLGFRSNDIDNYWLEPIAIIDELYNRNFSMNISAGYMIKNNLALGFKAGYDFSDFRLKVDADILDIMISAKNFEANSAANTFSFSGVIRNYVPLDRAHRLFIVSETNLSYSHTSALAKNFYDHGIDVHKVKKEKNTIAIGLSPGFMYFMTSGFAFEFAMNPVVAYYENTRVTNNQEERGKVENYGLSFKFMPFNIQFGFAYYFGLDYYKNREYVKSLDKK